MISDSAKKRDFWRRFIAALILALFMTQSSLPYGAGIAWAEPVAVSDSGLSLPATLKSEVALGAEDLLGVGAETMVDANVLFMIDASAAMQFQPKGVMPSVVLANSPTWRNSGRPGANWPATYENYGYTVDNVIAMMRNATFGIGAMPVSWKNQNLRAERNIYGQDLDTSNNYVKHSSNIAEDLAANAQHYYAPFRTSAASGTVRDGYRGQATPLEVWRNGSTASHVGTTHYNLTASERGTSTTAFTYRGNASLTGTSNAYPYALIFKDPSYWVTGLPASRLNSDGTAKYPGDLVPNDSKMYITKLVLWGLLEDRDLWAKMRFGLATTYLPTTNDSKFEDTDDHTGLNNRFDFNGMYKVWPWGSNIWTSKRFTYYGSVAWPTSGWPSDSNLDYRKRFVNGALTQAITGNVRGYNALDAQYYPMWSHQTVDPLYTSITGGTSEKRIMQNVYKMLHRGSLLVPIRGYDESWTFSGRTSIKHVDRVRQWINGFADLSHGASTTTSPAPIDNAGRKAQWHYYRDPEIGVAGVFILPHAIYPDPRPLYGMDRSKYLDNIYTNGQSSTADGVETAVWYSHRTNNTDYRYDRFASSTELENDEQETKSRFNGGSGEAAGSVIDFFSPPVNKYSSLSPYSYPIRSTCEPNWLIVVTTGQELKPLSKNVVEDDEDGKVTLNASGSYIYTTAQAIKNLYDATNKANKSNASFVSNNDNPLRGNKIYTYYRGVSMWERNRSGDLTKSVPETVDLDEPIRTLVIGIVPEVNDTSLSAVERRDVEEMHINLAKMAAAGQGGNPDDIKTYADAENAQYPAFTASDPAGLMAAIKMAFTKINDSTVKQPGSGTLPQSEALDDLGDGASDMYSYQYRIMNSNQWEAQLMRDVVSTDAQGDVRLDHKWTIGEEGDPGHKIVPSSGKRNVRFWNGSSLVKLEDNVTLFGNQTHIKIGDIYPPSGSGFTAEWPPERAFADWLWGIDYAYSKGMSGMSYARSHMLTDIGQDGAVMVNDARATSGEGPLPGYNDWAKNLPDSGGKGEQDPMFYVQTNDGLLRLIGPTSRDNGREIMAILPPPSMIPSRLAALKTKAEADVRRWLDVPGPESMGGYRSYPAFTLDGSLQTRNFYLEHEDIGKYQWGKYLLGALGRGGKGLYMLDVSDHDLPKLMWYREAVSRDTLVRSDGGTSYVYGESDLSHANLTAETAYLKLGFNSPRPGMGVARMKDSDSENTDKKGMRNFIALAGGAMSDVPPDLTKNGDEGATLLMIDPQDGSLLGAFDGTSLDLNLNWRVSLSNQGLAPAMGMMVSEPALYRSKESPYMTGGVIAADNRGSIFRADLEDRESNSPLDPDEWRIATIATLQTDSEKGTGGKSYAIPHGVVVGMENGTDNMWIAGGTADVKVRKNAGSDDLEGVLENDKQMIFSFMTGPSQTRLHTRDDFQLLDQDDPDNIFSPDGGKSGWYFTLDEPQGSFREYVSVKPILINGTLYVVTFLQKAIKTEDSSLCVVDITRQLDGESRLYAVDIRTGRPTLWKDENGNATKYLRFEHIRIVSLTVSARGGKGKPIFTFEILDKKKHNLAEIMKQNGGIKPFDRDGDGEPDGGITPTPLNPSVSPSGTIVNYWLTK